MIHDRDAESIMRKVLIDNRRLRMEVTQRDVRNQNFNFSRLTIPKKLQKFLIRTS